MVGLAEREGEEIFKQRGCGACRSQGGRNREQNKSEFTRSKHPPTPPPPPRAPKRARTEQAPPPPEELYKINLIIYQAKVAENAAQKMKAQSEAALQFFAEQEKFFKGLKEEMEDELALLELPK